jgi:hypothetical protein
VLTIAERSVNLAVDAFLFIVEWLAHRVSEQRDRRVMAHP